MRQSAIIALVFAALLPQPTYAVPFSASEHEANPGVDVLPPTPQPVRPVNPSPVMAVAPIVLPKPVTPAAATASAATQASEPAAVTAAKKSAEEENPQISNTAVLQGLNKVTGHISKLEGPIGGTLHFGSLEIIPRRCWNSAPEDRPENAILLEIREVHNGEESHRIFLGWMFSSSPGLSGLEHPVYDITAVACEFRLPPDKMKLSDKPVEPDADKEKKAVEPVKKPAKRKKPTKPTP